MKKLFVLSLLVSLSHLVSAQVLNNLVVFSNEGERFTLILNGERQNDIPDNRVRVTDLTLKVYKVTLLFENQKLKTHNTTLTFFNTNTECVFTLTRHGKKHTMDYVTSTPINQSPIDNSTTSTVDNSKNTTINTDNTSSTTPTSPTEPAIPTPGTTGGNQEVAINTKIGGIGIGNNGVNVNSHGVNIGLDEKNKSTTGSVKVLGNEISIHKSLKTGCKSPMSTLDFKERLKLVTTKTTDSTKLIEATKIINANCLETEQVRTLLNTFETDLTKLHFAKKAYLHTSDLHNFGKLEDSFKSQDGKKDLHDFVKNQD